jgi:hypothetical protein
MPAPDRQHLLRHSFVVVECTIPDGLTIQEWRRTSAVRQPRRRRLFK